MDNVLYSYTTLKQWHTKFDILLFYFSVAAVAYPFKYERKCPTLKRVINCCTG